MWFFSSFGQTNTSDKSQKSNDYPFPVNYIEIKAQQQTFRMVYMFVKSSKPNGKTVVLLHGKNFNGAYWKTTAEFLSEHGYSVVIPDQIGFGKSLKPEKFQFTFQQLAVNTKVLLDSLKIGSAIVLGHSMGGMLAVRFTLMYPEFVSKLILEDPIGLEDYKLKVPYQTIDNLYKKEMKQDYETLKNYQKQNYYHGDWKPAYDQWLNNMVEQTKQDDYPLIAMNNALTTDMIMTQPVVYELQNIKVPTFLVIGGLDKTALGKDLVSKEVQLTMGNYVELGEKTQKTIPDCKLVVINEAGHLPHIESFEKFSEVILTNLTESR